MPNDRAHDANLLAPQRLEGESFEDYQLRRRMMQVKPDPEPAYTTKKHLDVNNARRVLNAKIGARQVRKLQKAARRANKT